jgi:hypothetical protein
MLKHTLTALTLIVALPTYADDFSCTKSVGARTIDGNVIVPSNRTCTLTGTYVKGNVEVKDNAKVLVRQGATVIGNIQSEGGAQIRVRGSEVDGDVQLTGVDSSLESLVVNSRIGGTVDWNDNSAPFLIRFTQVNSDVKVNQNAGLARIFDNVIDGNLQCQSNEPPPRGARNRVGGNKEDQCRRF